MPTHRSTAWLVPTGLILLSFIPSLAGSVRLGELATSTTIDESNARFFDSPIPVITHIVSVVVYCLLGAFQFVTWRRRRTWHRVAGRILIPAGLLSALSGLWMTVFYELPSTDGPALVVIRLVFGVAMVAAILLGIRSTRRREFIAHGAWMTRAYALGVAAGTQAIVLTAASLLVDTTHPDIKAPLMALSWIINVVIAEWVIRRRGHRRPTMRAAVYRRFGGPEVVSVAEVARPIPRRGEVLVRVQASTVSAADRRARSRDIPNGLGLLAAAGIGAFRPRHRILGMDVAGTVAAVGPGVSTFAVGDPVAAWLGARFGGHAEYARVASRGAIARRPADVSAEHAVSVLFGGMTALTFLDRVVVRPTDRVLVTGASGAVGTAVVQLLAAHGAEVTAVCRADSHDLVRGLGASRTIDYREVVFATESVTYDIIVDCAGTAPIERSRHVLATGGTLLRVSADLRGIVGATRDGRTHGVTILTSGERARAAHVERLMHLLETGTLRPVIDRAIDLADIPEAHRFVDSGQKRGAVVLRVTDRENPTAESARVRHAHTAR